MKILYSAEAIAQQVARLGQVISDDYRQAKQPLLLLIVLKGALIFASDLMRQLTIPCTVACIRASSYRQGTNSGELTLDWDQLEDLTGRDILVIEDIVDTGKTAQALLAQLRTQAASIQLCTLLDKPQGRQLPIEISYRGFVLTGDPFIVGYGLDYAERYRELPYIGVLEQTEIKV